MTGTPDTPDTSHLFLTGLMGAGKSTIGRALAEQLARPFLDLDARIEAETGRRIPEIFAEDGEDGFRDLETSALAALAQLGPAVVATGGGAAVRPQNREIMRHLGKIIWLDIDPGVAAARTRNSDRPLLQGTDPVARLRALLDTRQAAYADCDMRVDAGQDVDRVVVEILDWLPGKNCSE